MRGANAPTVSTSLEVAGTVNGNAFDTDGANTLVAKLDVTAISGSPTLDVKLQTTDNPTIAGATWQDVGSFAQKTGVAAETKFFTGLGTFSRWVRTVAGTATPKATYTLEAYTK